MHPAAVVAEQWLWHERYRLAVLIRHHVVGRFNQRVEALIDLALPAGGYFVMMALNVDPALDHRLHHLGPQVLIVIGRRNWKIAFLVTRTIAQVGALAPRIPAAFLGIDKVVARMLVLI